MLGRFPESATPNDLYLALALAARREVLRRWVRTSETYYPKASRTVVLPLGRVPARPAPRQQPAQPRASTARRAQAMAELGLDLDALLAQEEEPGLGNGGLGRLAACFLDSLATLADPGDRLRHPLRVRHLRPGDPRRLAGRDDRQVAAPRQPVGDPAPGDRLRGRARRPHRGRAPTSAGATACAGCPSASCSGVAYDTPILGYRVEHRQPAAAVEGRGDASRSTSQAFNSGDYYGAVDEKIASENITKVLYPNDELAAGQAAAPRAAVLLRLLLAAGHDPHPPAQRAPDARRASPRSSRSSSTTRTRRSPSPS